MKSNVSFNIAVVKDVENKYSIGSSDGLRVRAVIPEDKVENKDIKSIPWAFPLLPKTIRTLPKEGEAVLLISVDAGSKGTGQRYFIGPIISQDQYQEYCNEKNATSLLKSNLLNPTVKISNFEDTTGAYPKQNDVALVGRGREDIILRDEDGGSEIDIRAGIKGSPINSSEKGSFGNIVFNGVDPAYIQLKYKKGIATGEKKFANSVINIVANRINIMSNKDGGISHNLEDKNQLVKEVELNNVMDNLHQVPKGDKLVELLDVIRGAIMNHVHPWAGMEQCGDDFDYINRLKDWNLENILSEYVRIS